MNSYYNDNRLGYNDFLNTIGLNSISADMDYNPNINKKANNLFGAYEGYINGNMFRNLYSQYKNYVPSKLIPTSEREEYELNLNQMHFAMHEINLYLDVYPDDNNMMNYYIKFRDSYNKLRDEYQKKYAALNPADAYLNNVPFGWVDQKFPWDRREV